MSLDNKISNIIGTQLPQWLLKQLEVRSRKGSLESRDNDNILFLTNKSAWIRLVSSVDVTSQEDLVYFRRMASESDNLTLNSTILDQTSLAKNYILFGGTSKYLSKNSYQLRSGLGKDGAYGILGDSEIKEFGYRPMPGITRVTIETQGKLGSVRGAIINFKCWDKNQLDIIDALYFKLGYTMFLEWGHTYFYPSKGNTQNLDPDKVVTTELYSIDPFEENLTKEEINIKIAKNSRDSEGNYDAMLGIVTNFSFSYNQEGGYDCELRLMALGILGDSIKINNAGTLPSLLEEEILKLNKTLIEIEQARLAREAAEAAARLNASAPTTTPPPTAPPLKIQDLINQYLKYDATAKIYTGARIIYPSNVSQKISAADIQILNLNPTYGDIFIIRRLNGFIPLKADLLRQVTFKFSGEKFYKVLEETKNDLSKKTWESDQDVFKSIFNPKEVFQRIKAAFSDAPEHDSKKSNSYRETLFTYNSANKLSYNIKIRAGTFGISQDPNIINKYYPLELSEYLGLLKNVLSTKTNDYIINSLEVTDVIAQPGESSKDTVTISTSFFIDFSREVEVNEPASIDPTTLQEVPGKIVKKPVQFKVITTLEFQDTRFIESFITPPTVIQPAAFTNPQSPVSGSVAPTSAAATTAAVQPSKPDIKAIATQIKQSLNYQSTLEIMLRTIQVHALNKAINKTGKADLEIGKTTYVLDIYDKKDKVNAVDANNKNTKSTFLDQIFSTGVFSTFINELVENQNLINDSIYTTDQKMNPLDRFKIQAKYGFATSLMGNKENIDLLEPVNFQELLKAFVVPYQVNQEIIKGTYANHPVYIPLGLLLMILNHACTIYDTKKDLTFQSPLVYVDFNPELNFCLTNKKQLSTDPWTCLIPFEGSFEDFKSLFDKNILSKDGTVIEATSNSKETVKLFNPETQDFLSGTLPKLKFDEQPVVNEPNKESGNVYRAKMMNILLNIDYLVQLAQQYSQKDGTNSVYLKTFLEQVLSDVNKSLGNFNVFRLSYNDSANTFQIVDDQVTPTLSNEKEVTPRDNTTEIPLVGKHSIAKSIEIKTEMSSKLSNMMAISANSTPENKATLSTNGDSVGFINTNYIDRYVPDRLEITGSNETSKTSNDALKISAGQFNNTIADFYSKINPSQTSVGHATNYYIEKMTLIKNNDYPTRASFMIPLSLNFTTDGISGMSMGHAFTVSDKLLPYTYTTRKTTGFSDKRVNNVGFVVVGLTHTIENNQWNTSVKGNMIFLKDKTEFEGDDIVRVEKRSGTFGVNQNNISLNESVLHGPIRGAGSRVPRGTDQTLSLKSPETSTFIFGSAKSLGNTIKTRAHGAREPNQVGQWQSENAWDLMVAAFTPVYAIYDGTITNVNFYEEIPYVWGYRFTLVGADNQAFYTHLDRSIYSTGTKVKKGQLLGYVGQPPKPDYQWSPHLHIALYKGDLIPYLTDDGTIK